MELLLANKALTDGGWEEAARGLAEALSNEDPTARTRLATLNLSGNSLTTHSLPDLANIVRLSSDGLQELDLSGNNINVTTDEEAHQWKLFLDSLTNNSTLQLLNLSGNDLSGSLAWEIFAKCFADQFVQNHKALEHLADDADNLEDGTVEVATSMQNTAVSDDESGVPNSMNSANLVRGLPAVTSINLQRVNLMDAGAMWLSYSSGKHKWVQHRLTTKHTHSTRTAGIDYTLNEKLSTVGRKLLKYAEAVSYDPMATMPPVPVHSPMSARKTSEDVMSQR